MRGHLPDARTTLEALLGTVSDLAAIYGPALAAVVEDGTDPAAAVAEAEGQAEVSQDQT